MMGTLLQRQRCPAATAALGLAAEVAADGLAAGADVLHMCSCHTACQASARCCDKQYSLMNFRAGVSCAQGQLLQPLGWTIALYV